MPRPPDISVADVFRDFWAGRIYILGGILFATMIAFVFVFVSQPHYKASMIVAPANTMNGAEISSLMADDDLFALRYLIQRVGVSNSSDFVNFENIFSGPSVAEKLLDDERILSGLAQDRTFRFSSAQTSWNAAELSAYLARRVKMEPMGAAGLRSLRYYHTNADFAVFLLQKIHAVTDDLIREKIRSQASERVQYLNEAIARNVNPEHRRTLTTLLLEQERLLMLVSIDQPYAAAIIEPTAASAKTQWPDKPLVFSVMVLIGAFIGFVVFSLRHRKIIPE